MVAPHVMHSSVVTPDTNFPNFIWEVPRIQITLEDRPIISQLYIIYTPSGVCPIHSPYITEITLMLLPAKFK